MSTIESLGAEVNAIRETVGKQEKRLDRHEERLIVMEGNCNRHEPLLAQIRDQLTEMKEDIQHIKDKPSRWLDVVVNSLLTAGAVALVTWLFALKG